MKQVIAMYITVGLITIMGASQASACGFLTKLAYGGECSEGAWIDNKIADAEARGESFITAGKYSISIIGDAVTVVETKDLIDAYNKGGKEAVIALIGADAVSNYEQFDEVAQKAADEAASKAEYIAEQSAKGEDACFDPTCGGKYNDAISADAAGKL